MEWKNDASKICGVCGDKALGYNFNAITCESCKAFFRRNALAKKDFRCPFNQQCEITTVTRRFCQKCRLDKCFTIGMRKDYIMSDEDKFLKRQKIEENRARKRQAPNGFKKGFKKVKRENVNDDDTQDEDGERNTDSDTSGEQYFACVGAQTQPVGSEDGGSYTSENTVSPETNLASPQNDNSMIRTMLTSTPNSVVMNGEDSTGPFMSLVNNNDTNCNHNGVNIVRTTADVTRDVLQDVKRIPIEANSIESILCEAIKLEYEAYSSIAQCHSSSRELNDAERAKLNELIVANKALHTPLDEDLNGLVGDDYRFSQSNDPALVDVINLTAVAIRRLIKMAKKINAFKNMCQEDQVALLKGGCTEMMILRSMSNFDPTKQMWKFYVILLLDTAQSRHTNLKRRFSKTSQRKHILRAGALHESNGSEMEKRREHHTYPLRHSLVHTRQAARGTPGRYQTGAKFVLLPPEEVSGERLCGMRGEIDVPQADTEDRRASQVERGCHQRLPGHEPFGRGTIAHRDFRSKALVLSL